MRRRHRRPTQRFRYTTGSFGSKKRTGTAFTVLLLLLGLGLFLSGAAMFLQNISIRIAVSDACDIVTAQVNTVIAQIMAEGAYDGESFVSLEKDEAGEITAVSSNMARINALSAEILERVIGATENRTLEVSVPLGNLTGISLLMGRGPGVPVEIPIGNLTGISLLMGRGPSVPVQIIVLTSSRVEFNNNVVTAGINQTKHQINLEVIVDIDTLIPWGTESAQVVTEVMVSDVTVVGKVPDTYLKVQ